jgi:hypothetical protein
MNSTENSKNFITVQNVDSLNVSTMTETTIGILDYSEVT